MEGLATKGGQTIDESRRQTQKNEHFKVKCLSELA